MHGNKPNITCLFIQWYQVCPDSKVHGAHLGPVGPRWAPCSPHEPYYQGEYPAIKPNSDEWAEVEVEFWAKHM